MSTSAKTLYSVNRQAEPRLDQRLEPRLDQRLDQRLEHVRTDISPDDTMFEGDFEHYFGVGRSALRCIGLAMSAAGRVGLSSIMDFGCGFGRVTRVLRAAFPGAHLSVCDISRGAVDYCAEKFEAEPVYSNESPSGVPIPHSYDLIWCGSLLTHLDSGEFTRFLDLFYSMLLPGGLLVATTHGPFVAERIRTGACTYGVEEEHVPALLQSYSETGFGYGNYAQSSLTTMALTKYGISVSKPSWVCRHVERLPNVRLLAYTEKAWDNHQDCVALMREPG
jgi:SAM-dependent methyltransferase